jgi:hypothetical protein
MGYARALESMRRLAAETVERMANFMMRILNGFYNCGQKKS